MHSHAALAVRRRAQPALEHHSRVWRSPSGRTEHCMARTRQLRFLEARGRRPSRAHRYHNNVLFLPTMLCRVPNFDEFLPNLHFSQQKQRNGTAAPMCRRFKVCSAPMLTDWVTSTKSSGELSNSVFDDEYLIFCDVQFSLPLLPLKFCSFTKVIFYRSFSFTVSATRFTSCKSCFAARPPDRAPTTACSFTRTDCTFWAANRARRSSTQMPGTEVREQKALVFACLFLQKLSL